MIKIHRYASLYKYLNGVQRFLSVMKFDHPQINDPCVSSKIIYHFLKWLNV